MRAGIVFGCAFASVHAPAMKDLIRPSTPTANAAPIKAVDETPRVAFEPAARVDATNRLSMKGAMIGGGPSADAHSLPRAIDGRDDTAWIGAGTGPWELRVVFPRAVHLALLRAHFGESTTVGVPVDYRWEAIEPALDGSCDAALAADKNAPFSAIDDARDEISPDASMHAPIVESTRRSWFVDVDACAVRLVVDKTNGGPPVVRDLEGIAGARDVLRDSYARSDGDAPGFSPVETIDGTYAKAWQGAAGKKSWTLTWTLPTPIAIDRIRLVLGLDATSAPRDNGIGRNYGVAYAPAHYRLETSVDGEAFVDVATEPHDGKGALLPIRRRLVTIEGGAKVKALRLVIDGATNGSGAVDANAAPIVREVYAYAASDHAPILAEPWILSVNANPAGSSHLSYGGELANDMYWGKFLQLRFGSLLPNVARDDRFTRALQPKGLVDAPRTPASGEGIEAIEGDDPALRSALIEGSYPRPIVVLSGSNDWDFARLSGSANDPNHPGRWRWDPLLDAHRGGMGQLEDAVKRRVAPFLGFCGGAQILALLEAKKSSSSDGTDDGALIDAVLRRTFGKPIRGFAPSWAVERAWPGGTSRAEITFFPDDRLFVDIAGTKHRDNTKAFPESHADVVRPDAFSASGPLRRFDVVAKSLFCAPNVVTTAATDPTFADPSDPFGHARCAVEPQVFESRDDAFPVIGAQFHAEQYDFPVAGPGDPPEAIGDGWLFIAAEYDAIVDAYVKYGR